MAAVPPYDGAVFVEGTMETVGVALLAKASNPNDIVAYAGYGFWAPASVVKATKGASATDVTNAPIAPTFEDPSIPEDAPAYEDIAVNDQGAAIPGEVTPDADLEANAPTQDVGTEDADPNTAAGDDTTPTPAAPDAANQPVAPVAAQTPAPAETTETPAAPAAS